MKCPVCTTVDLTMTERSGVEIDYCPTCRGVWLDRGELDKLIERSAPGGQSPVYDQRQPPPPPPRYREDDDDDYYKHKKKRRGGFLGEIFDFD